MDYQAEFVAFTKPLGEALIQWASPDAAPSPLVGWPLTEFSTAFAIALGYLMFVLFGSLIMQFLPAIPGLYPLKFLYNVTQIMLCSYMCIEAGVRAYTAGYTLLPCEPFDEKNAPLSFILYVFYISKVLDFMDTFFIIAEKRWKQLSFLHVYHHTSIFLFYWLNAHVSYDGDIYLTIVLNGLIHTMMYTYYFITLHTKDVWWKSALTMGQMIQFIMMNAQAGYLLYFGCASFPRNVLIAYAVYIFSLLLLFANFFVMSYIVGGKKKSDKQKKK